MIKWGIIWEPVYINIAWKGKTCIIGTKSYRPDVSPNKGSSTVYRLHRCYVGRPSTEATSYKFVESWMMKKQKTIKVLNSLLCRWQMEYLASTTVSSAQNKNMSLICWRWRSWNPSSLIKLNSANDRRDSVIFSFAVTNRFFEDASSMRIYTNTNSQNSFVR